MGSSIKKTSEPIRRGVGRMWFLALTALTSLAILVIVAAPAFAAEKVPTWQISQEKAPELDYSFNILTALASLGLLVAFLIMLFVLSEREFKGVINERFGPGK